MLNKLKDLNISGYTPTFMIGRGNGKRKKKYALKQKSWIGLSMTLIPLCLSVAYLVYMLNEVSGAQLDIYRSLKSVNMDQNE